MSRARTAPASRGNVPSKARSDEAALVHLDRLLDEALEETFPASDPTAVSRMAEDAGRAPMRGAGRRRAR